MTLAADPVPYDLADGLEWPRRRDAVLGILLAIVLVMTDGSMMNVALPALADGLGIADARAVWLVNGYQLVLVMGILPLAALGEVWGFHRLFRAGIACFALGALLSGLAMGWGTLLAGRLVQGLGAAMVLSCMPPLVRHTYPSARMGAGIGLNALTVGLSSAAGPAVGAALLLSGDWRLLFLASLPLAALAWTAGRALPRVAPGPQRLTPGSVTLSLAAVAALVLATEMLAPRPLLALGLYALAGGLGLWLFASERRRAAPLLPVDLLARPVLRLAAGASACVFAAQIIAQIALPFFLTRSMALSTLAMGLLLSAWPLAVAVVAPFAGRLADRAPTAHLAALGSGLLAVALAAMALGGAHWGAFAIALPILLSGIGFGLFQSPNNRAILMDAPKSRSGGAGAIQALARQLGMSLGAAVAAGLFAAQSSAPAASPIEGAGRLALGAAATLALSGCIISGGRALIARRQRRDDA